MQLSLLIPACDPRLSEYFQGWFGSKAGKVEVKTRWRLVNDSSLMIISMLRNDLQGSEDNAGSSYPETPSRISAYRLKDCPIRLTTSQI
jgi:hypothetical protein